MTASVVSATAAGVARSLGVADLPAARAEIELSDPPTSIDPIERVDGAQTIVALIRLHTHPVGTVVLDGRRGLDWATHAPEIWAAVASAVNDHLVDDGAPPVTHWTELTGAARPEVGCERRRWAALAGAPMVSVVVATRERPELLRRCLDALRDLEYPDYEVIVVDNAPVTSSTADMVATRYADTVRYACEPRQGLAVAHNRGVEMARGTIVAFVDDDVLVDRHWLTALAEGFAAGNDVGCVTGLILPAELETPAQLLLEQHGGFDKGLQLTVYDRGPHRPDDVLFPFTAGRFGSGANMAFDIRVLRSIGGFDTSIGIGTYARGGDDLAAFFRVVLDHQLVYQPAALVWHRHHRDMAALRTQAYGYGVGLGAYLASVLVREPRMLAALLHRFPAGLNYAFSRASERNRSRYEGLPAELARAERRGLLAGPAAYAVSRYQSARKQARSQASRPQAVVVR
jgi:GT2 family glycosyltransferase